TLLPQLLIAGVNYPNGLGVNRNTHALYVAGRNDRAIYRINPLIGAITHVIPVGRQPFGTAVNTRTNKVYVANFQDNTISVINEISASVMTTITLASFGEPTYVAINEQTNRIYVPLHRDGRLAVINGETDMLLATVEACAGAFGVAVDSISNRIYVSCRDAQIIRTINAATNEVIWEETIYLPGMPFSLGLDSALGQLYVPVADNPNDPNAPRKVFVFRVPAILPSPHGIVLVKPGGPDGGGGVVVNPNTHRVFVTNSLDDSVTVFDGRTLAVLDTIPVGDNPLAAAVDAGLNYIYVGNRDSNNISLIPDW
ncbi:MAG: YncE family protein, partial [Anaerolineae bacterium]